MSKDVKIEMTQFEARNLLHWIIGTLEHYRGGSSRKALLLTIIKIENAAGKKLHMRVAEGCSYLTTIKKTDSDVLDELMIESRSNPVPVRYKELDALWERYWEIEDAKRKKAKEGKT